MKMRKDGVGERRIVEPAQLAQPHLRQNLGHIEAAVGGEAFEQDLGEALRRGAAARC